jgi:hypothetical protein
MIALPLTYPRVLEVVRDIRARDRREICALSPHEDLDRWARDIARMPGSFFVFGTDLGEMIAAGGWARVGPGWCASWLVATPRIQEIGMQLHQFAVRAHRRIARQGYDRIETTRLGDDDETSQRWLRRLGYRCVGFHDRLARGDELVERWARVED